MIEVVGEGARQTQDVRVLPLRVPQSLDLSLKFKVNCLRTWENKFISFSQIFVNSKNIALK